MRVGYACVRNSARASNVDLTVQKQKRTDNRADDVRSRQGTLPTFDPLARLLSGMRCGLSSA